MFALERYLSHAFDLLEKSYLRNKWNKHFERKTAGTLILKSLCTRLDWGLESDTSCFRKLNDHFLQFWGQFLMSFLWSDRGFFDFGNSFRNRSFPIFWKLSMSCTVFNQIHQWLLDQQMTGIIAFCGKKDWETFLIEIRNNFGQKDLPIVNKLSRVYININPSMNTFETCMNLWNSYRVWYLGESQLEVAVVFAHF